MQEKCQAGAAAMVIAIVDSIINEPFLAADRSAKTGADRLSDRREHQQNRLSELSRDLTKR